MSVENTPETKRSSDNGGYISAEALEIALEWMMQTDIPNKNDKAQITSGRVIDHDLI